MPTDILVVDDEEDIRDMLCGVLEDEGYATRMAANTQQAIDLVLQRSPSMVLLDIWLNDDQMDGLELLKYLKSIDPDLPVLMMSGHGTIELAVKAIRHGAYDFLEKPFKTDRMLWLVARSLEASNLKRENQTLRSQVHSDYVLLGSSISMNQLRNVIGRVAPTNSRILITGPAGAGKEVVARAIHQESKQANGIFQAVNAASIAPEQMELELFGEEGSDGRITKIGLLERAHNGTLYLDEVSDMPIGTQNKILRVLVDQKFRRVGGNADVSVEVRVISSSARDLQKEIREGRFREELFFRLNVVNIEVPPLHKHLSDIPELVEYFVEKLAESSGLTSRKFSDQALAALQTFNWPGNVRQLRNMVEQVLILCTENPKVPIMPTDLSQPGENGEDAYTGVTPLETAGLPLRAAREQFERDYLKIQITRFSGNISRTAAFVGMERSALHRKLRMLGVHSSTAVDKD